MGSSTLGISSSCNTSKEQTVRHPTCLLGGSTQIHLTESARDEFEGPVEPLRSPMNKFQLRDALSKWNAHTTMGF